MTRDIDSGRPVPTAGAPRMHTAALVGLALLTTVSSGCSSDEDDEADAFVVRTTGLAAASASTPLRADGPYLAFSVSEAAQGSGGTDYNGDGDFNDGIAVRVNTSSRSQTVLDVAVDDLVFARRTLFMTVQENRDGVDWNSDGDMSDRVLLHQTTTAQSATYLDDLDGTSPVVAIGGTVIYASATAPTAANESNLRYTTVAVNGATPSAPATIVCGADVSNDGITYQIHGYDDDVVFVTANETVDGDLNGDGDATDTTVLAVIDAGDTIPEAFQVGVAISPSSTATAVPVLSGSEWLVAFLADESQANVSLNDPSDFSVSWAAAGCAAADVDTNDHVLHWFQLGDLSMGTAAVNTGLVGRADGRALALRSRYVGVTSPEASQGAGCDLNGDGDSLDAIFRWTEAQNAAGAVLPPVDSALLVAVSESIPGGAEGVVRMSDVWVVVVDEAADGRSTYDTDGATDRDVALALNPSAGSPAWNAEHTSSAIPVGISWLAEDPENPAQFYAAITEEIRTVFGEGSVNSDGDTLDSVATVPRQTATGSTTLSFPGVAIAAVADNAGITVEENVGVLRVSEADQGADLNGDSDTNDELLLRFSTINAFPLTFMGATNDFDRTLVDYGPGDAQFGAFLAQESQGGSDLNGDGDTADIVVRYFRLP